MNDFYDGIQVARPDAGVVQTFMNRVFGIMSMGLGITALASFVTLSFKPLLMASVKMTWVLLIVELGVVIYLSARVFKMSPAKALFWFGFYSCLNGVFLTPIFLIYTQSAIATAFVVSAGMFAGMAVWGYATGKDLSSLGSLLTMGLWGIILASLVNMFLHNSAMQLVISYAAVGIFMGLTAWDIQKLKRLAMSGQMTGGIAVMGALQLYLDFINLFLNILYILGGKRD